MESSLLGLVLDSSVLIAAERSKQSVTSLIEAILLAHGSVGLSLSPVTVAEFVHGIYRAKMPEISRRRRDFIEELPTLVPSHPVITEPLGWWVSSKAKKQPKATFCHSTT